MGARHDDARVQRVIDGFEQLAPDALDRLGEFYAPDARFKDPFNEVQGLAPIRAIFAHMYVALREPKTWGRVAATWRVSGQVGLLAALGSACWFTGFATAPVALVRVVGQVEVLFTLGFSRLMLREPTKSHEVLGLLLVTAGVVLALLGALG
jgi:drug/metabolite transporter (DMT)-like permease